ncbi:MAG: response regulator [Candidatus Rokubacteria bacterium]|nr:response regulator [Candidatus Rokubacteria bacterium]
MAAEEGLRVLVVEDDRRLRDTLVDALEMDGHAVRACDDGEEALEALRAETPPHVILLDLVMPRAAVDGFELIRRLGEYPADVRDIPLVVFSGLGRALVDAIEPRTAAALNIVCVLAKPLDLAELRGVTRAVGRRRAGLRAG